MNPSKPELQAPAEPDPRLWLTHERLKSLEEHLGCAASLLRKAGLWRAALGYWVRWQLSLEAEWPPAEEQACLAELEQQWLAKHSFEEAGLSSVELRAKLRVAPAALRWCKAQWGHRLESLYLQRKSGLDRASCRLLRLTDKNLALELYHRIKAGETSFERAAFEFGEGPERFRGGLVPLQPLGQMPFGLAPLLERLDLGQLSMPLRLNQGFCLVQLVKRQPSQLDSITGDALLLEQLAMWVDAVVDVLVADLSSSDADRQSTGI
jgi:hypothetical protein